MNIQHHASAARMEHQSASRPLAPNATNHVERDGAAISAVNILLYTLRMNHPRRARALRAEMAQPQHDHRRAE